MSVDIQLSRYDIEEYAMQPGGKAEWEPCLDVLPIVILLAEALKRGSHPNCKYRIRDYNQGKIVWESDPETAEEDS